MFYSFEQHDDDHIITSAAGTVKAQNVNHFREGGEERVGSREKLVLWGSPASFIDKHIPLHCRKSLDKKRKKAYNDQKDETGIRDCSKLHKGVLP